LKRGQLNVGFTATLEPDRIGTIAARFGEPNAPGAVDLIALGRASFPKMKKSIHREPAAPARRSLTGVQDRCCPYAGWRFDPRRNGPALRTSKFAAFPDACAADRL
jgi:hypothetical protein